MGDIDEIMAQNVGEDLTPESAAGSAVCDEDPVKTETRFLHHVHVMTEGVGNGLQKGSIDMHSCMGEGETVDDTPGIGVEDRSLFSKEIRENYQPSAPGSIDSASSSIWVNSGVENVALNHFSAAPLAAMHPLGR